MSPDQQPPSDTPLPECSDGELARRVQQGDLAAYDELVRRHLPRANLIAWRLMRNTEDAEDLVQEAFLRALDRINLFDTSLAFAPWFTRLLTNLGLNAIAARKRHATEPAAEDLPDGLAGPDRVAEQNDLGTRVRQAVALLPPRQRVIVTLFELDGWSSAEVAEHLGITPETVRWHLHKARRTLRSLLADLRD